jgi:hypothetical protein
LRLPAVQYHHLVIICRVNELVLATFGTSDGSKEKEEETNKEHSHRSQNGWPQFMAFCS